jgi:dTDP-4-dehydrorhamnose 3,5-epimerase
MNNSFRNNPASNNTNLPPILTKKTGSTIVLDTVKSSSASSDPFLRTEIEGCFTFRNRLFKDQRGSFTKVYARELFMSVGIDLPVAEVFISNSQKGVIRGMHFQTPPYGLAKVVSCLAGRILDVILDLRKNSTTFGKSIGVELSPSNETTVYVPCGCAHGFYAYEDNSLVSYVVDKDFNQSADKGILWNSFGFKWPSDHDRSVPPILSVRDLEFPAFQDFKSPF